MKSILVFAFSVLLISLLYGQKSQKGINDNCDYVSRQIIANGVTKSIDVDTRALSYSQYFEMAVNNPGQYIKVDTIINQRSYSNPSFKNKLVRSITYGENNRIHLSEKLTMSKGSKGTLLLFLLLLAVFVVRVFASFFDETDLEGCLLYLFQIIFLILVIINHLPLTAVLTVILIIMNNDNDLSDEPKGVTQNDSEAIAKKRILAKNRLCLLYEVAVLALLCLSFSMGL